MRPIIFLRTAELIERIDALLAAAADGYLPIHEQDGTNVEAGEATEPETILCLEEPGRRDGVLIAPGNPTNALALAAIKDCCVALANTPGGGALLVGVQPGTGQLIGTELDVDYLVTALPRLQVEPLVRKCAGQRLVCLVVAPSRLPLENSQQQVTWVRAGAVELTDRFTWWQEHQERAEAASYDEMVTPSEFVLKDIPPTAMALARSLRPKLGKLSPHLFLRHIGAVHPNGHLSRAGALLLTPANRVALELHADGQVIAPDPQLTVLEQLKQVEADIRRLHPVVPYSAYHEALLNSLVHRDWSIDAPSIVTVTTSGMSFRSPGGFHGGVRPDTAVGRHDAKSPALTDLFRELHLLDKQVSGLNRMVYRMIFAGFQPPLLHQIDVGEYPVVECAFDASVCNESLVELARDIVPADRAFDHRVALIINHLEYNPAITVGETMRLLCCNEHAALQALRATAQTTVHGVPLVELEPEDTHPPAQSQQRAARRVQQ